MNQKVIELKRMLWVPPLIIVFFGLAAKYSLNNAIVGNTALIYKSIHITPDLAVYIYWLLFCVSSMFVILGCFLLMTLSQGKRKIVVGGQSIIVPKFSFSGVKHIEVPFSEMKKLELFKAGNGLFLNIHHTKGKSSLAKAAFKSKAEFEELQKILAGKICG